MTRRQTYRATAYRSGKWWAIESPDVRGALSQSRRIDQIERNIREAISLVLDVPEDSFDVEIDVQLPDDVRAIVAEVEAAQERADAARRAAAHVQAEAARMLVDRGLTLRDVGQILGVSHQRVDQLLRRHDGGNTAA